MYVPKYKSRNRIFIKKPQNYKDVLRKCDFDNLWSERGRKYSFILPELSAIYSEEWDWTNIIWYREKEKIEPILEIAKKAGLFVLK